MQGEETSRHEATGYIYYYNNLREHPALGYQPPYLYLKQQLPDLDDNIRLVVPILLDEVAVALGPWSGYNVLAQNPIRNVTYLLDRR
ncbi:MAG: hypothetical protein A2Y60_04245 [Chloroflexi bacterium RBG_13_54_9]|nr:MAG: hypothetical protein A2Y60_04245 [Chloroflexi bacterium RBG_13_54_9]